MKVLLMMPINRSYVVMPSLGLGYIASVLRNAGHKVSILHCNKEKMDMEDFREYLLKNEFDVIGIQMFTFDINPVKEHIEDIRGADEVLERRTTIILGGYHPSGDPEHVLNDFPEADFAFRSEVEIGFPLLLEQLPKKKPNLKKVPNLIWRSASGSYIHNHVNPIKVVEDLDSLPFPAWDLMDPRTYPEAPHGGFFKSFPTAPIIITRGCPMECTFCAGKCITTKQVRKRSARNVIEEIKFLRQMYGVNDFLVEDENFTLHKPLVMEFCNLILRETPGITWSCPSGVRLDTLDKEIIELMEKAGCYSLSVGVEFGSQRIHDLTKKHLTLEKIKERMALFKGSKIKTTGFFMFGIPGETKEEMLQTIKFSKELNLDRAQFNNFMPLPGSELYNELIAKDSKFKIDSDHFFVHDVGYIPEGMTAKEMKDIQRKAYIGFYLRPKIIWNLLKEITSFGQLSRLVRRFFDGLK